MRKGITPIIAIIVLLLITVALAGATWTYLSAYWVGIVGQSMTRASFWYATRAHRRLTWVI
jgi:flagellin-like protein